MAFMAFLCGIFLTGILGEMHAICLVCFIVALVWLSTRLKGLLVPRVVPPLFIMMLVGCLRLWLEPRPEWHRIARPQASTSLLVRLKHILHRDRFTTSATADVLAICEDGLWHEPEAEIEAVLVHGGVLRLIKGATYVVRVRQVEPKQREELLKWPSRVTTAKMVISTPGDVLEVHGNGDEVSAFDSWRFDISERIRAAVSASDFAMAILLGEGGGVEAAVRMDFSSIGTAHVLAVSGLHVVVAATMVGFVLIKVFGPLAVRFYPGLNIAFMRSCISAFSAWFVASLAGMSPSSTRAACMCTIAMVGAIFSRRQKVEAIAAASGLLSLIIEPWDAFELSFLLSYSAVFGLAALTGPIRACFPIKGRGASLLSAFAVSSAATLATTPISAIAFRVATPYAPFVNLLVVPIMTLVVMPLAAILLISAALWPKALTFIGPVCSMVFEAFIESQRWLVRNLPIPDWCMSPVGISAVLAITLCIIAMLIWKNMRLGMLAGTIGIALGLTASPSVTIPSGSLAFTFLDVGKGDATLITCPNGKRFLVDTGEERASDGPYGLVARLLRMHVRELDGIVLTHADEDHMGGVLALASSLRVQEVLYPCQVAAEGRMPQVLKALDELGIAHRCLVAKMDALPGCAAESVVIWPPSNANVHHNDASLVFRVVFGGRAAMFTGDLPGEREVELVTKGVELRSEVLKLGHHGSISSTTLEFLEAVRPVFAVVSGYGNRITKKEKDEVVMRVMSVGATLLKASEKKSLTLVFKNDESKVIVIKGGF